MGIYLERILRDRIYPHLEENGLVLDNQHGFVHDRSCFINFISVFEEVTKGIDKGRAVDVTNIDFNKALDKAPHDRLIQKIKMHQIHSDLVGWIQNELSQRRQRIVVGATLTGDL